MTTIERNSLPAGIRSTFQRFIQTETSSGVVLLTMAVIALAWANSPWADSYHSLWHQSVRLQAGGWLLEKSLAHWINDGLMALFFLYVGLEIKRELLVGELSSVRRALLPAAMALGGMIVPALLFSAVNAGGLGSRGWGIPMATDIAFALGVLLLAGSRVPEALKMALLALAIVDDLGAVAVIAVFYTSDLVTAHMLSALGILSLLALLNYFRVKQLAPYLLLGFLLWLEVLQSGVHATVAGVLLAFSIPVKSKLDPSVYEEKTRASLKAFTEVSRITDHALLTDGQQSALHEIRQIAVQVMSPLQRLEHALKDLVAFGIMPLFALANAGVTLPSDVGTMISTPVSSGVILGLVLGKPLGILLFTWLCIRLGWGEMPRGATWRQLIALACLAGIGFTMSLFVADLAFARTHPELIDPAKLGILLGTIISGTLGFILMRRATAKPTELSPTHIP
jgi:NhaA family Na+:H+ antiporter